MITCCRVYRDERPLQCRHRQRDPTGPRAKTDLVRRHSTAIDIALIVLVSLGSALPHLRSSPKADAPDSRSYIIPAENLLAGRGLNGPGYATTFTESIPGFPSVAGPETLRPPVYPALIAASLATGAGLRGVIVLQDLLNIAVAIALYAFLFSVLRSRTIAAIAALIYAWFPLAALVAGEILSETVFTALLLSAIIAAESAIRRQSTRSMIVCGLLLGLATMTRPIAMYFAVPLGVVVALCVRRRVALIAALLISSQLLPIAWTYRNLHAAGVATFSTSASENLLFQWAAGVHVTRNSSHLYRLTASQQQFGFRAALHRARLPLFYQAMDIARADGRDPAALNPAQKSIYERSLAIHLLHRHPIELAEIMTSAVVELQLFAPASIALGFVWIPRSWENAFVAATLLMLIVAIAGLRVIGRSDRPLAWLIAVTIGYFTLAPAIPETSSRYMLAYVPLYAAALAAGIVDLAPRAFAHVRRAIGSARSRASREATNGPS
jgi:4-amino-4-deoxy-L-arabinose transferase-like glycosyltransferase